MYGRAEGLAQFSAASDPSLAELEGHTRFELLRDVGPGREWFAFVGLGGLRISVDLIGWAVQAPRTWLLGPWVNRP